MFILSNWSSDICLLRRSVILKTFEFIITFWLFYQCNLVNTRSRNTLDFSGSGIVQKKTVSVVNYQICFDVFFVRHSGCYIRRPRCNEIGNMAKNALILRSCGIPLIRSHRTDIVFLQSASNDLCNQERSVNDIFRDYVDLIITLRFQFDVQQVVVLQVLHRKPPTPHIRYEVDTVCKFKHACYQCKKNHSVINCWQEQNQPQPTQKQSREQQAPGNPKDKWISSDPHTMSDFEQFFKWVRYRKGTIFNWRCDSRVFFIFPRS